MSREEPSTGLLFTSVTCPNCPIAKKYFDEIKSERNDIDLHSLSVNESKGSRLANKFGVKSVPTFIFYGPGHPTPLGLVGAQPKEIINKYIDVAIGLRSLDEIQSGKKVFSFKKLIDKLKK